MVASSAFAEPDPADRHHFNRVFYRNRRPTWFGHWTLRGATLPPFSHILTPLVV